MNSALEMTLWFIFALVLGLLVLNFTTNINYIKLGSSIKKVLLNENENELMKPISINESIFESLDLWKKCGFGELNKSKTIYINQTGKLNLSIYFNLIKKINLCHIISSPSENCGNSNNEEVIINNSINGEINTPKIIQIKCNPINQTLEIS